MDPLSQTGSFDLGLGPQSAQTEKQAKAPILAPSPSTPNPSKTTPSHPSVHSSASPYNPTNSHSHIQDFSQHLPNLTKCSKSNKKSIHQFLHSKKKKPSRGNLQNSKDLLVLRGEGQSGFVVACLLCFSLCNVCLKVGAFWEMLVDFSVSTV
ncbi:hypothetical protein Ancab_006041 [Ancistrocladus abbreviatus]